MRALIIGSGAFATAFAQTLASRDIDCDLWCRREFRYQQLVNGQNSLLPGVKLSSRIQPILTLKRSKYDFAVAAVPTQHIRSTFQPLMSSLNFDCPWVSLAKGIERETLKRPSEILGEMLGREVAVLSGPSHAEELARGIPTAVTLGLHCTKTGKFLQQSLSTENLRIYLSVDPVGIEWAGALKNVIALAAGVAVGVGFGDNTLAALITRGSVEIARFGEALGGQRETFYGLAGVGDLMVTCFSEHSRNRRVGVRIGRGEPVDEVVDGMQQVVEGIPTSEALFCLARDHELQMPISQEVYEIFFQDKPIEKAVKALLGRSLRMELED